MENVTLKFTSMVAWHKFVVKNLGCGFQIEGGCPTTRPQSACWPVPMWCWGIAGAVSEQRPLVASDVLKFLSCCQSPVWCLCEENKTIVENHLYFYFWSAEIRSTARLHSVTKCASKSVSFARLVGGGGHFRDGGHFHGGNGLLTHSLKREG